MADLKIIKFQAENVAGIIKVEIDPDGQDVTLAGPNGAGKSSICESILTTLRGGKLPLHNDEQPGSVFIDLGAFTVKRTITDKERLEIRTKEGFKQDREPRKFLTNLIGELGADPAALVTAKEKDQLAILLSMAPGLEADLAKIAKQQADIDRRRSENWGVHQSLRVKLKEMPEITEALEPVSIEELIGQLQAIRSSNEIREKAKRDTADAAMMLDQIDREVEQCNQQISNLQAKISSLAVLRVDYEEKANMEIAAPLDEAPILQQIQSADAVNARVAQAEARRTAEAELAKAVETAGTITADAKVVADTRSALLATKMPIPDLGVSEGIVTYKGVPLSRLSSGEKARVGVAIATASNPNAKVLICDNASLLDNASKTAIKEAAVGYQIWWIVNEEVSRDSAWFIEGGRVSSRPSDHKE